MEDTRPEPITMANTITTKRKVGRPKSKPQSAEALRALAIQSMSSSQRRLKDESVLPVEELKTKIDELSTRKRYSAKEMNELRKQVFEMYNDFKAEQEEEQAQQEASLNAALSAISIDAGVSHQRTITEAEWNALHDRRADGSKKRGPKPMKKKMVWDLSPGECGTAEEPLPPVDLDAMEKAHEEAMMEQAIEAKKAQPKYSVGKRLRSAIATPRSSVDQSRFYY